MKKQEALKRIEAQKETIIELTGWAVFRYIEALIEQLDEPETGHADEAPRYVKNILARLRELPEHDREVWLKVIMGEFERDFSCAKWREGYEQGKFEGMLERDKATIPQYIADKIEYMKKYDYNIFDAMRATERDDKYYDWLFADDNMEIFTIAWQYGYEVEKEPKYTVRVKGINGYGQYLNKALLSKEYFFASNNEASGYRTKHTRKQLENDAFGWVFDCEGIEIEEVE